MAGRPTKYHSGMGTVVVEMMRDGASMAEVCAELDICFESFQSYRREYPEFAAAVSTGERLSQAWWERAGRTNLQNKEFSYTGWYMNMKNRFGWRDKQETELTGKDGGAIITRIELVAVDSDNGKD